MKYGKIPPFQVESRSSAKTIRLRQPMFLVCRFWNGRYPMRRLLFFFVAARGAIRIFDGVHRGSAWFGRQCDDDLSELEVPEGTARIGRIPRPPRQVPLLSDDL